MESMNFVSKATEAIYGVLCLQRYTMIKEQISQIRICRKHLWDLKFMERDRQIHRWIHDRRYVYTLAYIHLHIQGDYTPTPKYNKRAILICCLGGR